MSVQASFSAQCLRICASRFQRPETALQSSALLTSLAARRALKDCAGSDLLPQSQKIYAR
eukprot:5429555-Pyramimonas_sp.AAC.1